MPLSRFHPLIQQWFTETLGAPSAPQRAGWPAIARGSDTLILAPTGTGKTLAAFLHELDALIREGTEQPLANAIHLLYISPLKALGNDVHRNLEQPLRQLQQRFKAAGETFPEIRVAVRTGDTSSAARARMLRKTPHILITTPESLHLLLTSVRGRSMFSALRAVIVDEIHAVAGTKRGAHLAVTLERLSTVTETVPQRIGLSATQRPLEEIAHFLSGCDTPAAGDTAPRFRPVEIVDCGLVKQMETSIVSPVEDLAQVDGSIWASVAPLVLERVRNARTTLIFVNNRGQAERMAARVNTLAGEEMALPYHGSLSRERRFLLEERLKRGELRALVTTSSLELGIDVGSVDLVLQLQSPKRVAAALQRVGRAGHTLGAVSRGAFIPTFRDDALEQMAIVSAMASGDVEPTRVVQNALDVLAQLLVAMVASDTPEWTATRLFDFVRRAYPFHALTRTAFDETLAMLAGKYPSEVAAELDARLQWNRITDLLTPARSARMVATISGGTIPDRGLYAVILGEKTRLGELDEEFVHESRVGDAFQLGSSTWRIRTIEHDRVTVMPAPGAPARMPFWHGEFMARSYHLSARVGALRRALDAASTPEDQAELQRDYHADEATVRSLVDYVQAQRQITGIVPDERQLVLEYFRDEVGSVRMVLHAPFGGRVNAPWGMALGRRMRERLGVEVQVQTTDDGLMLRLPNLGGAVPVDAIRNLTAAEADASILEEVGASSLFGSRFRMNAARALLLPRGNPRRRMPLWLQRLKSADLLQAVREFPSFPILVETYREVLQDSFDLDGLREVLTRLASGALKITVAPTTIPSPFARSLQFGFVIDWMYGDDAPRAEARAALLSLDRVLLDEVLGGAGADEATLAVLDEVLARRRGTLPGRQARDADELVVLVDRAGDLTRDELEQRIAPADDWTRGNPIDALLASGRMISIDIPDATIVIDRTRFILVDAYARYATAWGDDALSLVGTGMALSPTGAGVAIPEALQNTEQSAASCRREIVGRWISWSGPFSIADVVGRYGFDAGWTARRLDEWIASEMLVRGTFGGDRSVTRWVSRRLLEQSRRRELAQARKQIEAVPLAAFAEFLQRWQHLAPGERQSGCDGTALVIEQLYGFARPAAAWERDYLPARIERYERTDLDALAASGALVWLAGQGGTSRAAAPPEHRGVGAVRFVERGTTSLWVRPPLDEQALSVPAMAVRDALRTEGALFTGDLAAMTAQSTNRIRDSLRELVAAGLVTNDTVDALRDVMRWVSVFPVQRQDEPDPARWLPADFTGRPVVQRRVNLRGLARWKRPDREDVTHWGGRWSLVHRAVRMSDPDDDAMRAEAIARQWLARYGIVSRDWWRREVPPIGWRSIYHELKRLEFRGEVRRGYFVSGFGGAQFALPEAIELLRSGPGSDEAIAFAASDPANVYGLVLAADSDRDPLSRPRGAGAMLVTVRGVVVMAVEGRGKRVRTGETLEGDALREAVRVLVARLLEGRPVNRHRDVVIETINGEVAIASPLAAVFESTGFKRGSSGVLRYYAGIGSP